MSKRESVLCDIPLSNWNKEDALCFRLAIGACVLCHRDMCEEHAMHKYGGIVLRVDSITPANGAAMANGPVQDFIYEPQLPQKRPYPQVGLQDVPHRRLNVCLGCRSVLQPQDFNDAVEAVLEAFRQALAAAMTARGLEAKPDRFRL